MTPRVISKLDGLLSQRRKNLIEIFHPIAKRSRSVSINQNSSGSSIIFGISDGNESGVNYKDWRFRTHIDNIRANYHEVWMNLKKDSYFLERSYFHLYIVDKQNREESEYVLLHCDASEPDNAPHSIYKQSPHIHLKAATDPIPKAHLALYNGRVKEILKNLSTYNKALSESVQLLDSQILSLH